MSVWQIQTHMAPLVKKWTDASVPVKLAPTSFVKYMARILLAAVDDGGEPIRRALPDHELVCVRKLNEAWNQLTQRQYALVVCDVSFDESQMFPLFTLARKVGVPFVAYTERDFALGESMEVLVQKAVSSFGLFYLDLKSFDPEVADTSTVIREQLELHLDRPAP